MKPEMIKKPFFGMLEVTARCNSRCRYCYCWKTKHTTEITIEDCASLFPQMYSLGVRKLILTGGEPLLRDDLEDIVRLAYANRLHTSITTNGLELTAGRLSALIEAGLLGLTLSLDSTEEKTYKTLRGVPFAAVNNALSIAGALSKEKRIAVSINCVLTALNFHQVPGLVQKATGQNVPVMIQPCNTDSRLDMTNMIPRAEQFGALQNMIEELISMKQKGAMLLNSAFFLKNITHYWMRGDIPPVSACHYGYANITIKHNGDIVPCWRLPAVGSLHSASLVDTWSGEGFEKWRRRMLRGDCRGCWLACSFDWQTLWHEEKQVERFWEAHLGSDLQGSI
jgi:pyrroloquinoline quinone biosynthesis protein E